MPLRDFSCYDCADEGEIYYSSTRPPQCGGCGSTNLEMLPLRASRASKTGVFPFITPHIDADGRPIVVDSIGHLRSLEKRYGVVLSAFSNEPTNLDPISRPPRYLGEEVKRERRR